MPKGDLLEISPELKEGVTKYVMDNPDVIGIDTLVTTIKKNHPGHSPSLTLIFLGNGKVNVNLSIEEE